MIGFYGVPARERLFQAARKQEEEIAIATDRRANVFRQKVDRKEQQQQLQNRAHRLLQKRVGRLAATETPRRRRRGRSELKVDGEGGGSGVKGTQR